jgi:hypothetical protein
MGAAVTVSERMALVASQWLLGRYRGVLFGHQRLVRRFGISINDDVT